MITGSQIRMARGHLRWSTKKLAKNANLGDSTVRRMEATDGVPSASGKNLEAVQKTLESHGLTFIEGNEYGPGIRAITHKPRRVLYKTPALKLGMRVKVGNIDGIICQIFKNDKNKDAEIVYDDNGVCFIRDNVSWSIDRWAFTNTDAPIRFAEQDPLLSHYIAELRMNRR